MLLLWWLLLLLLGCSDSWLSLRRQPLRIRWLRRSLVFLFLLVRCGGCRCCLWFWLRLCCRLSTCWPCLLCVLASSILDSCVSCA